MKGFVCTYSKGGWFVYITSGKIHEWKNVKKREKKVVLEMKQFADTKADWICKRTVKLNVRFGIRC